MIRVKTVELRKNLQHYIDLALSGEDVILEYKGGVEIKLQPNQQDGSRLTQAQKILGYFESPEYRKKIQKYKKSLSEIPEDPQELKEYIYKIKGRKYGINTEGFSNSLLEESVNQYDSQINTKSAFLDTNIVLDLVCSRSRLQRVKKIIAPFEQLFISTSTYLDCFYISQKEKITILEIRDALFQYNLVEIQPRICYHAANLATSKDDVEDCAILLTAQENRSVLVTADKELVKKYGHVHQCLLVG